MAKTWLHHPNPINNPIKNRHVSPKSPGKIHSFGRTHGQTTWLSHLNPLGKINGKSSWNQPFLSVKTQVLDTLDEERFQARRSMENAGPQMAKCGGPLSGGTRFWSKGFPPRWENQWKIQRKPWFYMFLLFFTGFQWFLMVFSHERCWGFRWKWKKIIRFDDEKAQKWRNCHYSHSRFHSFDRVLIFYKDGLVFGLIPSIEYDKLRVTY